MTIQSDEQADQDLLNDLLFRRNGIELVAYSGQEKNQGKTRDFKLMKNGKLMGYCEMKSTKDNSDFENPKPKAGETIVTTRKDSTPNNLSRHVMNASAQLAAVNPKHDLPNIMVIMNHVKGRGRSDLHFAIAGVDLPEGGKLFALDKPRQVDVWASARKIDLFLWVDVETKTVQHVYPADAPHRAAACEMLRIEMEAQSNNA